VGARLARLARHAQVVCVTHLAQIASYGDVHLALRKRARGDETTIAAVVIDGDARNAEIARMLSGDERGVALEHAAELMTTARAKRPVRR
jgi:DNA repair protein RecN (Recombination protein N)